MNEYSRYVTLTEAAERLRVSLRTLYRWMREGRIKVFHLGKTSRINVDDLEAFIKENEFHGNPVRDASHHAPDA
jgi:excisionase family DNA binding protein